MNVCSFEKGLVGARRCRFRLSGFFYFLALGLALPASATLIAYDDFDYDTGGIVGSGGASEPGWESAWGGVTGVDEAQVVTRNMAYASEDVVLNNSGSGKALASSQIQNNALAFREFTANASDELFVSFLFQVDTPDNSWFTQFWLWDDPGGGGDIPSFCHFNTGSLGSRIGDGNNRTTEIVSNDDLAAQDLGMLGNPGDVFFFVLRLSKSGVSGDNYDTLDIYLNPDSTTSISAALTITEVYDSGKEAIDHLGLRVWNINPRNEDSEQYFSELRVGSSWEAVVIPEPSTAALAAMALSVIFARHRRRACRSA